MQAVQGEGHTPFPEFFFGDFYDVALHFSYRFTYFDLIWCFIIGSWLHFYIHVYYVMAYSFLAGLVSFSVRIETYYTQVSFLQLLAPVDYSLPDLLSHLVLKSYY